VSDVMQYKTPFSDAFCVHPENIIKEIFFSSYFSVLLSALRDQQTLKYVI
jgi:hypothetical protein